MLQQDGGISGLPKADLVLCTLSSTNYLFLLSLALLSEVPDL